MTFDMTKTIKSKTDQVNFDDFLGGQSRTIKITDVTGSDAKDQPVSIHFEGDGGKPYKPCLSMRRVLVVIWGDDGKKYIGNSMTIYGDPNVVFGGIKVGGIRISHMSGLKEERTILLTSSKANKKPFTVKPLSVAVEITPELKQSGESASKLGVAEFVRWRDSLPAEQKEMMRPYNGIWSKAAKAADDAGDAP